jgi:methylphosphotriester-DNA--protein-cysteine methyltransferase
MRYDSRIDASLRLLLELSSKTTVRELATAVDLSPSRCSHLFAMQIGMMPGKFLRMLRAFRSEEAMAREILKSGPSDLRLTENWFMMI